ncbi:MAG TPA: FKBP-type peptidyl-prolyl cis-trans isomerase [Solirubrobacterales bacterium]
MDRRVLTLIGAAAVLAIMVLVVVLAGGGGDDEGGGSEATAETPTKPEVELPEGDPPTELQIEDLEEGDGDEVQSGDTVSVHYVGVDFESGEEFDNSYDRGEPFTFQVGAGSVIQGWEEGLIGMKEGGRRQLVIPPDMAYGKRGAPPSIGRNATLVFVVDLISVE